MKRTCKVCGVSFEAKRRTAEYCSSSCRVRMHRAGGAASVTALAKVQAEHQGSDQPLTMGLVAATMRRLAEVDQLDTVLGQQALLLASRLVTGQMDTGSSAASVSKEFRSVMAEILAAVPAADDELDELRKRRAAKLSG